MVFPMPISTKKTGEKRLVVDYRRINKISRHLCFPLPVLTDVIDTLAENRCAYFTSLDLKAGYHQIKLSDDASAKSAFCIPEGAYQWRRLPYWMQGSGQIFTLLMSEIFRGMQFTKVLVYVDDILVFPPTLDQHCTDLREVFQRLRHANMRLHPKY